MEHNGYTSSICIWYLLRYLFIDYLSTDKNDMYFQIAYIILFYCIINIREVEPFNKILSWRYSSVYIQKVSNSCNTIQIPPFTKESLPPILMPELYHTRKSKTYIEIHDLGLAFIIKHSKELKTFCQNMLFFSLRLLYKTPKPMSFFLKS